MPELKAGSVVLLLAAAACLTLYVLGLGLGATDPSAKGRAGVPPEERRALRDRLFKTRRVSGEELSAACPFSGGVLVVGQGQGCRVEVAPSKERLRALELEPLQGSRVNVSVEPGPAGEGEREPAVPARFKDLAKAQELDVFRRGAVLEVSCVRPVPDAPLCRVKVG